MDYINLKKEQLLEPKVSADVLGEIVQIARSNDGKAAKELSNILERELFLDEAHVKNGELSALEEQYLSGMRLLHVVGLSYVYGDAKVLDIFEHALVDALKNPDVDCFKQLKQKLLDYDITERDAFKEKVRKALHLNNERLTQKYLILDGKEAMGTIGNWLRDYIQNVGGGNIDKIQIAEYFVKSPNVVRLGEEERVFVRKLIEFYETTKISSLTPKGIEGFISEYDPVRKKQYFINSEGRAEEVDVPSARALSAESPAPLVAQMTQEKKPLPSKPIVQPLVSQAISKPAATPSAKKESVPVAEASRVMIKPEKKQIPVLDNNVELHDELDKLVDDTVTSVGLTFDDIALRKRFKMLVSSRLRGVRDLLETRAILTRDAKVGGMGLNPKQAEQAEAGIEKAYQQFEQKWKKVELDHIEAWKKKNVQKIQKQEPEKISKTPEVSKESKVSMSKPAQKPSLPKIKDAENLPALLPKILPANVSRMPSMPSMPQKKMATPIRQDVSMSREERKPQPGMPQKPQFQSSSPQRESHPKMTDIRPTRLLGPVEELRDIKVVDFRRLSKNPSESASRIKSKIDLLGEDSFIKRLSGIDAWKHSEVNQLYLELSNEALQAGKSIETIIENRKGKNQPYISADEIHAIMELNKSLRF